MIKKRLVLKFSPQVVNRPIISALSRKCDISFNILQATITQNKVGRMILEMEGSKKNIDAACAFFKKSGVSFQRLGEDIKMDEKKCVSCGVCIGYCPTGAFSFDAEKKVVFDPKKCIACEFCVTHCPYNAMTLKY
ncbi:MAG: (Fe-S)-binding protein [Elusimicrobia bacterium CG_4_10_14_3_um_filter_49_12_50_7]|nr:MAG: (Fe-S)-binding protein [Elusimicrobia bacterium CG03_land_8_20_14_0_80_50_18]PIX14688.1 MAG: (Fe-S)-binding protein [Elusimicrobia bacterium CG_4_8_14_3_um_filter_50_9]PIY17430.1 MAG: (Fe-S)-binding protein [Elusimicrobia bacterium CG_4_10_14_3_um_filter_49_12_50_7]